MFMFFIILHFIKNNRMVLEVKSEKVKQYNDYLMKSEKVKQCNDYLVRTAVAGQIFGRFCSWS